MLEEQSVLCADGGRGFGQVAWQQLSLLLLRLVVLVLRVVLVGLTGAGIGGLEQWLMALEFGGGATGGQPWC